MTTTLHSRPPFDAAAAVRRAPRSPLRATAAPPAAIGGRLLALVLALHAAPAPEPVAAQLADSAKVLDGAGGAAPAERLVPYTSFELPNGLHVVVHEDRRIPMAAVSVVYHVGSGREDPGRSGFAHLFEHVMFEGSANVPPGAFDAWLEQAGGDNNGFTNADVTAYYEVVPVNALELALFLEADRLGTLLQTLGSEKLDVQREVVKNERRERYESQPYGLAGILLRQALYPPGHPYRQPTIGSTSDLDAASLADVEAFFRRWYVPANATLVVAGAVRPTEVRELVERHFGPIPAAPEPPPPDPGPVRLDGEVRLVHEDDVQLPRLYAAWLTPAGHAPGDAALDLVASILAEGKSSRLYRRLVYELELAQDVSAAQVSDVLGSTFQITATARPGHGLEEILAVVDEELRALRDEGPTPAETLRAVNQFEASFYAGLEPALGRALALALYDVEAANPGYFEEDLAAHRAPHAADVREAAREWLGGGRVLLSVVPRGQAEALGLTGAELTREEAP